MGYKGLNPNGIRRHMDSRGFLALGLSFGRSLRTQCATEKNAICVVVFACCELNWGWIQGQGNILKVRSSKYGN